MSKSGQENETGGRSVAMWQQLLKSPFCLLWYIEKTQRRVFVDKQGFTFVECPSLQCHSVCRVCSSAPMAGEEIAKELENADATARIVTERCTGITRVACDMCGASWDVFSLCQFDNQCDRTTAIHSVVNDFMNAVSEITTQPANVPSATEAGSRHPPVLKG